MESLVYAIILLSLSFASITDLKSKTIPIWLFPGVLIVVTIIKTLIGAFDIIDSLLGILLCAIVFFIMALFFNGGGGDIIMMSCIGWCIGLYNTVYLILMTSFICFLGTTIFCIYKKANIKNFTIPYAPCVTLGYLLLPIISLLS